MPGYRYPAVEGPGNPGWERRHPQEGGVKVLNPGGAGTQTKKPVVSARKPVVSARIKPGFKSPQQPERTIGGQSKKPVVPARIKPGFKSPQPSVRTNSALKTLLPKGAKVRFTK